MVTCARRKEHVSEHGLFFPPRTDAVAYNGVQNDVSPGEVRASALDKDVPRALTDNLHQQVRMSAGSEGSVHRALECSPLIMGGRDNTTRWLS